MSARLSQLEQEKPVFKIARTLLALLTAAVVLAALLGPATSRQTAVPRGLSVASLHSAPRTVASNRVAVGSQGKWLALPRQMSGTFADDSQPKYLWQIGFSSDPGENPLTSDQS